MGYLIRLFKWFSISVIIMLLIFIISEVFAGKIKIKSLSNNDSVGRFKYEKALVPRPYVYIEIEGVDSELYKKLERGSVSCSELNFLYLENIPKEMWGCNSQVESQDGNVIHFDVIIVSDITESDLDFYVSYNIDSLKGKYKKATIFAVTDFEHFPNWFFLILLFLHALLLCSLACLLISPVKHFFRDR